MAAPATTASGAVDALWAFAVATCVKLLLSPAYRSTDFDVHRYWLALTRSLPIDQWYVDASSVWTLDYPPIFAFFSLLLALPASLVDPTVAALSADTTTAAAPRSHVLYLRISVAFTDLFLLAGAARVALSSRRRKHRPFAAILILWSPALFIVDHVHFQYNGFLLGVLLLSLSLLEDDRDLAGGAVFAALLCSKHLFLVAAPVYFVYLLRHYCGGGHDAAAALKRFVMMGAVVGSVFLAAFGPFIYFGQIRQVLSRLFPFGRGLCHAYWAPNFWVFYIILDKILAFVLVRLGFCIFTPEASFTGGLVGDGSPFSVLPQVTPAVTFLLVILSMAPCLVKAFSNPQPRHIIRYVAYACSCGFMFGWHVHEKASLHFTIPLAAVATDSLDDAKHYFLLSIVSCYSMFPLLFEPQEYPIKVLLLLTFSAIMWVAFSRCFFNSSPSSSSAKKDGFSIGWASTVYLIGILIVELWAQLFHGLVFGDNFPFLPLMMVSLYSAIGIGYSWVWQLCYILKHT